MIRRTGVITLVAFVVALSLGSPLSAAPVATKKAIVIDSDAKGPYDCFGKFILQLGTDGDAGKVKCARSFGKTKKTPEGLTFSAVKQKTTFTGKAGTFVILSIGRDYDIGFGNSSNWSGTWSVVSGTGTYAGMQGHGIWVGADNLRQLSLQQRYAGFVTLPS